MFKSLLTRFYPMKRL